MVIIVDGLMNWRGRELSIPQRVRETVRVCALCDLQSPCPGVLEDAVDHLAMGEYDY